MSAKAGWTSVAFGDVVRLVRERSSDPEGDGFERYVGLEHIDPGDLSVRRWGNVSDGTTFANVFRAGQVLFGKRRAYQRKVAVAAFDGVCSGDIYVFEPQDHSLLPELLPFICQTERFFEHAVVTSAGSLSPRTNWSSLAEFEFQLPRREIQERLVAVLQAAALQRDSIRSMEKAAHALERAEIEHRFHKWQQWPASPMYRVGEVQLGQQMHPKHTLGIAPRPYLRVPNITDGYLDLSEITSMDFVGNAFLKHRLQPGDLLLTEGDLIGPQNVGRVAMFRGEIPDCCVQKTLLRYRPGPSIRPEYALWACRYLRYAGVFAEASTGTTVAHLVAEKFRELAMPLAPKPVQNEIATAVDRWVDVRAGIRKRKQAADDLFRVCLSNSLAP